MAFAARNLGRVAAAAIAALALTLPGLGAAAEKVTFRLGNATGPKHVQTLRDVLFAEMMEKRTNGDVKIQVFPAGQLGKQNQQVEGTMSGSQDMFGGTANFVGNYQDDWRVLSVFYAFNSRDHIVAFGKSEVFAEMNKRLIAKTGTRVLHITAVRTPSTFISKKPMLTVQDIKAMKVRIPDIAGYARSLKALSATPTPVDWADTYLAFSQGVVDVVQSSLDGIRSEKFTDFGKFVLITEHNWEPTGIIINEKSYQKLSPAQQKTLNEVADESADFYWKKSLDEDLELRRTLLQRGATLVEADPVPWRDQIVKNLVPDLEKEKFWTIPQIFQQIQALDPAQKKKS